MFTCHLSLNLSPSCVKINRYYFPNGSTLVDASPSVNPARRRQALYSANHVHPDIWSRRDQPTRASVTSDIGPCVTMSTRERAVSQKGSSAIAIYLLSCGVTKHRLSYRDCHLVIGHEAQEISPENSRLCNQLKMCIYEQLRFNCELEKHRLIIGPDLEVMAIMLPFRD